MKSHEIISIFYKKQCIYNPQMEKGKPYKDNRTTERTAVSVGDKKGLKRNKINNMGTRYPSSIQTYKNGNSNRHHPTQKPVELLEYLIKTYTNEGETVLDFTMGSGSTGVACKNTKRSFIGIEMDEAYFKIAEQRIKENEYKLF